MSTQASDNLVTVKMRTRTVVRGWGLMLLLGVLWAGTQAWSAPVETADESADAASVEPSAAESPVDVDGWVQSESLGAMLHHAADQDRRAVLGETWSWRSPTWIQNHSAVNLGDFPSLDDPTGAVERNLQTLEWALAEQRRLAAGRAPASEEKQPPPVDKWLRRLLPEELVSTLKQNREWVAASGAALMAIIWGTTLFARRPVSHVIVEDAPASQGVRPTRRTAHRGGGRHRSRSAERLGTTGWGATSGSPDRSPAPGRTSTRPAPLITRDLPPDDPSLQDTEPMPLRSLTPDTRPQRG